METKNNKDEILKVIVKQFSVSWTITSLSKEVRLSRVGVWKILKQLEKEKKVILSSVGQGRTNTFFVSPNWDNFLLEKKVSLILSEEALRYQRWMSNFSELRGLTDFLILYGSILHSPKTANDIDIIGVVSTKNNFIKIEKIIRKIQKSQFKKIHLESFTKSEFKKEIRMHNKIFIDAIKKGIVLFGQEKFVKLIKDVMKR